MALAKLLIEKNCKGMRATKALPRKLIMPPSIFETKYGLRKMERKTFFGTKKGKLKPTKKNEEYWLSFVLSPGSYATVYLNFLKEYSAKN